MYMDKKKLFKNLFYLIIVIFVLNALADKLYWYYTIWYFDMVTHFLGGFWIGLAFFYIFLKKNYINYLDILKIIFFVLFIGIFWEIFEFIVNNYLAQNPFNILDTLSDIFFDLSGGILSILYFLKSFKEVIFVAKKEV